jgi:hypothetical protein
MHYNLQGDDICLSRGNPQLGHDWHDHFLLHSHRMYRLRVHDYNNYLDNDHHRTRLRKRQLREQL